jgi:hypothetical protein
MEEFIICSGIGLGVYANAMLLLGLLALLNTKLIFILFIISIISSIKPLFSFVSRIHFKPIRDLPVFIRICFLLFVMIAISLFLLCFNPELETDAFMYHISAPLAWLQDGAIRPIPFNMHSQFHFLIQMLNLWILALPAKTIASFKLIQWYFGILLALSTYILGKRYVNPETGAAAMCVVFLSMEVSRVIRGAMVDVGVGFYVAVGFLCLTEAVREGRFYRYALSGIFYGLAFSAKNTGILFFTAALGALLLLPLFDVTGRRKLNKGAVLFSMALMALISLPWILKNAFFTGNPFYPFLGKFFPARMDYTLMANGFSDYYNGFKGYYTPWGVISNFASSLPLYIHNISYVGSNRMAVWMIFGILLLVWQRRRLDSVQRYMVLAGCLSLPCILLTPFGRFVIGLYPLACVLLCAGIWYLMKSGRWAVWILFMFIILNARFYIRENIRTEAGDGVLRLKISHLNTKEKGDDFLVGHIFPQEDMVQYMRENLTRKDKALICVNQMILIRCPIPFIPNPHMHSPNLLRLLMARESEEAVLSRLDGWGVTHLVITDPELEEIRDFVQTNFTPLMQTYQLVLYEKKNKEDGLLGKGLKE